VSIDLTSGYAPLPRGIRHHAIMRKPAALQLYIELLTRVRHEPGEAHLAGGTLQLEAGQALYSQRKIAEKLGMSRETHRRAESWLEKNHLIARKTTHLGTVVTILGYGEFKRRPEPIRPTYEATDRPTCEATDEATDRPRSNGSNGWNGQTGGDPASTSSQPVLPTLTREAGQDTLVTTDKPKRGPKAVAPIPFTLKELGQAFHRGAGRAFAEDSWDQGLAKPLTGIVRQLGNQGRTLGDVEAAGRVVRGWNLAEPVAWAWLAKAGNLSGAIAKAKATPSRGDDELAGWRRL
jgi:hypothetical protein